MKENKYLLGVDPGLTSGVAILEFPTGNIERFRNVHKKDMPDYLKDLSNVYDIVQVVMENFVLFRNKAGQQVGSKMPAVEVIGMVNFWANMHNIPIHMQMSNILPLAEKQSRITKEGMAHSRSHYVDAINHGLYFLYSRGLAETPKAKELKDE